MCNSKITYFTDPEIGPEEYPILTCCQGEEHVRDTVFNVCLKLDKDIIDSVTKAVSDKDGPKCIIQSPSDFGNVRVAIIKSCCGNIIHSLISYNDQANFVLPGFEPLTEKGQGQFETPWNENCLKTSHMDHVTYVCKSGESKKILEWYHEIFNMKRFLVSPQVSTL